MPSTDGTGRGAALRADLLRVSPAVFIALVAVADLNLGRSIVLGLVVVAPLLAATIHGPRTTAVYGVLAFVTGALLGITDDTYRPGDPLAAQVIRLLVIALGSGVAVAASQDRIEREERLGRVTKVAEAAQRAILLPVPDRVGAARVAVRYESAATDAEIGGDLYAVVGTPFGVRALVGDVRGKGLEAVRTAAQVLAAFRERASDAVDLAALVAALDRTVRRAAASDEEFVTAVVVEIAPDGRTRVLTAGHPPPFVLTGGRTRPLDVPSPGLPLGLAPEAGDVVELGLLAGDRLLLYTDGLTEARDPRSRAFLSTRTIAGTLASADTPDEALDLVLQEVVSWSGGSLTDDIALVVLEHDPHGDPCDGAEEGVLAAGTAVAQP